jgi:hypothetical protein
MLRPAMMAAVIAIGSIAMALPTAAQSRGFNRGFERGDHRFFDHRHFGRDRFSFGFGFGGYPYYPYYSYPYPYYPYPYYYPYAPYGAPGPAWGYP